MANFKSKSLGQLDVMGMALVPVNFNSHSSLSLSDPERLELPNQRGF